jgi:hypothetical protein
LDNNFNLFTGNRDDVLSQFQKEKEIEGEIMNVKKFPYSIFADYYGSYSGMGKEHEALGKWIVDNKQKVSGAPVEMYVT